MPAFSISAARIELSLRTNLGTRVGSRRALDNDASSARLGEWRTHKMLAPNQKTHDVLSAGGPFCFIIPRFAEARSCRDAVFT
ncbi:hypothetical protein [Salinisphaera sp.]|uniref:hypothetical protein n=1 Tax=Salinisphaera sp. TaxID=1914330 RepID=UPI000C40F942|nr:hypothetical protein [Salinisphaera sp.]MBS63320.1 hypothetical protein [Salinisphaera sp.]